MPHITPVTFIRDDNGEVIMLFGSPRSLRRHRRDFKFKRTHFYQIYDLVPDYIFHIYLTISEAEIIQFFEDIDQIFTELAGEAK